MSTMNATLFEGAIALGSITNHLTIDWKYKLAVFVQLRIALHIGDNTHSAETYVSWVTKRHRSGYISYEEAIRLHKKEMIRSVTIALGEMSLQMLEPISDPVRIILDAMMIMGVGNSETIDYDKMQFATVSCPVDVTLRNKKGEAVAVVKNHEVKSFDESVVFAISEGETDFFLFPADKGYYLDITGNDKRMMTVAIASIDEDLQTTDTAVFADVPVEKKEGFTFTPEWSDADKSELVSDSGETYLPTLPENVTIAEGMTKLPNNAFAGNAALTGRVVIPENITEIGS